MIRQDDDGYSRLRNSGVRRRHLAQVPHRAHAGGNVSAFDLVEERAVVARIAGKQRAGARFPQGQCCPVNDPARPALNNTDTART